MIYELKTDKKILTQNIQIMIYKYIYIYKIQGGYFQ